MTSVARIAVEKTTCRFDKLFDYAIPAGNKTAAGGHWEKGPDRDFINAMHESLGEGGIIAEDLGYLTPAVRQLLAESGLPGMKVLQFAFDSREAANYLPHT